MEKTWEEIQEEGMKHAAEKWGRGEMDGDHNPWITDRRPTAEDAWKSLYVVAATGNCKWGFHAPVEIVVYDSPLILEGAAWMPVPKILRIEPEKS